MSTTYTPKADSVAGRVCTFFKANPEEALSTADIAIKFEVQQSTVTTLLHSCFHNKLLARSNANGQVIIKAGPRLPECEINPGPAGDAARAPASPTAGDQFLSPFKSWLGKEAGDSSAARRQLPPLPPEALVIEKNVPIPDTAEVRRVRYASTFEQMQVGDSIKVPREYGKSVIQAAHSWGKKHGGRKFMVRELDEKHSRIWRKA